jgi:phage terminase large subunit
MAQTQRQPKRSDQFREQLEQYMELRGIWRANPVLYARQRLGLNPTWQQQKILEAVAEPGAKVTVRSGHGIGKSGSLSAAIWWKIECFDFPKIPCTAPSSSQLRDVLWSELSRWHRRSNEIAKVRGMPSEFWLSSLFEITQDRVYDKGAPKEWFAVARTARPENPDALQGFHASNVRISDDGMGVVEDADGHGGEIMFVIEEASGVHDRIFEVAEGALSSHGATLLMAGNPTRNTGYFANSHKRDRGEYTALHFRSSDSPLVAPDYRDKLIKKFGEGSNVVRVRADGEFPKADDDTLIPLEHAEAAIYREAMPGRGERRLGVDVARFGDDRTVFVLRQGSRVENIKIAAKLDTMEVAGMSIKLAKEWGASTIYVDAAGLGAGVYDRIHEQKYPCVAVEVQRAAPKRASLATEDEGQPEAQPWKLRDYLWVECSRWLRDDAPSFAGVDRDIAEDLAGELASVRFKVDSSGRIVIESKDDMKKRGLRSPDIADALNTTFAGDIFYGEGQALWEVMRRAAEERARKEAEAKVAA